MKHVLAMSIVLMCAAQPCVAQSELRVNDRVRVSTVDGPRLTRFYVGATANSLRLTTLDGRPQEALPWEQVTRLERSLGTERPFGSTFIKTLGISTATFGVLAFFAHTDTTCRGFCIGPETRTEAFVWGAVVGGALGIPLGVVLGLVVQRQLWVPVDGYPSGPQFLVEPSAARGLGFGLSIPMGRE